MTARSGNLLVVAAAAALLALLALAMVWALRPSAPPTTTELAVQVASELRCPDCQGLSAADSPTAAAAEIRREVVAQLEAGASPDEIKASFVARYGEWILLRPSGVVPWLVPLVAVMAGVLLWLAWLVRTGRRSRQTADSAQEADPGPDPADRVDPGARRLVAWVAGGLLVVTAIGLFLPGPLGLANPQVVNSVLLEAQQTEAQRQDLITELLTVLQANPTDADALSDLADAFLAGASQTDLERAARTLIALLAVDPERTDAYTRLITAYIQADDWTDAQAATDALAELSPDSADVAFFNGLIAWRGRGDAEAALVAFDEFLALAPDDPRATMIRSLRAEAASQ